jgi:hypothetical protein
MNKCFVSIAASLLFPFGWATAQISGFKAASAQTQLELEKNSTSN